MSDPLLLAGVAAAVLALNLPFGYWRAATRKFSLKWFVAIHAPVPAVVALRLWAGIPLGLSTLPVLVAAYFGGQLLGARYRMRRERQRG